MFCSKSAGLFCALLLCLIRSVETDAAVITSGQEADSIAILIDSMDLDPASVELDDELLESVLCRSILCGLSGATGELQTGIEFVSNPWSRPAHPISGAYGMWLKWKTSISPTISLSITLRKDTFEPIYLAPGRAWVGPESKRAFLQYDDGRTDFVLGDFQLMQGLGLQSWNSYAPIQSVSAPTRLMGRTARIKGDRSSGFIPSRRGLAVMHRLTSKISLGGFLFRSSSPGSIKTSGATASSLDTLVIDVSSTYRFDSHASIQRRNILNSQGYGLMASFSAEHVEASWFAEYNRRTTPYRTTFDDQYSGSSFFLSTSNGGVATKSEIRFNSLTPREWYSGVRAHSRRLGYFSFSWHYRRRGAASLFGILKKLSANRLNVMQLSWRTGSTSVGRFSSGIEYSSDVARLFFREKYSLFWHHSVKFSKRLSVRTTVKRLVSLEHDLKIQMPVFQVAPQSRQKSRLSSTALFAVGANHSVSLHVLRVFDSLAAKPLTLVSLKDSYRKGGLSTGVSATISNQSDQSRKLRGYYVSPSLKGKFPIASISGSSSAAAIYFSLSGSRTRIEFRLVRVAKPDISVAGTNIQIQISRR